MRELLLQWIEEYLEVTEYELVSLEVSAEKDIVIEIDRMRGVDVDFCAEMNRYLVAKMEEQGIEDYSIEVGSVSLTAPFKTKMQYEKHLGHDVEVLAEGKKYHGQLVSVDEENFSVDVLEKIKGEGGKVKGKKGTQMVTHTWQYEEVKYVKYDLKF